MKEEEDKKEEKEEMVRELEEEGMKDGEIKIVYGDKDEI